MISEAVHMDNEDYMEKFADGFFDLICEDPPYGSTVLKWDRELNYQLYFEKRWRILKDNGVIVVFSHQPFATDVINACRKYFRYELIFQKTQKTNFANAKKQPLRGHENMLIFYKKLPTFNPQKYLSDGSKRSTTRKATNGKIYEGYGGGWDAEYQYNNTDGMILYDSVLKFSNWNGAIFGDNSNASINPTQKPIPLVTLLIKMFTNEGENVLDGFLGSGTTRIACHDTSRNFYGCENREDQFLKQEKRFTKHIAQQQLFIPERQLVTQTSLL